MLFHQRIDFDMSPIPTVDPTSTLPVTVRREVYLRIPLSSTLWTTIEARISVDQSDDSNYRQSRIFPSRIMKPDDLLSIVFTGVDTSGLLRGSTGDVDINDWRDRRIEYRILWRIIPDPEDSNPKTVIALPIGRNVILTYSHGSSRILSLSVGGVDINLSFNCTSRVMSTTWFEPPFTSSWSLAIPKRIFGLILNRAIGPFLLLTSSSEPSTAIENQMGPDCYAIALPSSPVEGDSRDKPQTVGNFILRSGAGLLGRWCGEKF